MHIQGLARNQQNQISDGILAQQALEGNEDAFAQLVERYSPGLFRFIHRMISDYDIACDILQQVFLQLYLLLPKLQTGKSLKAWLFRVARNRCYDELRRKRVVHFSELQTPGEDEGLSPLDLLPNQDPLPEEVAEQHALQVLLQEA